jgi:solute carrier family 15 (peptide/histidine transporter), member 3/4
MGFCGVTTCSIALSCIVYVVGLSLITVGSSQTFSSLPLFFFGLYVCVALGAGGIKPNVVVLGADQFNLDIPAQRLEKESFFNWFYWSINIGSFLSYSVLANIAVNGFPPYIPEEQGFVAAFLFSTIAFFIGSLVFYGGREKYRRVPPKGSVLSSFFSVLSEAGRKTRHGKLVLSGGLAFVPGIVVTTISYFVTEPTWHIALALSGAGCVVYGTVVLIATGQSTQWVFTAGQLNGGSHRDTDVDDVRQVMRLMPYMSIIIVFWAAFSQMKSNFILQGCQMDLRLPATDTPTLISSATLSILNSGTILVFVPIFDRVVYPSLASVGVYPTVLRKIGAGLFFSFLAMVVAGGIELERKRRAIVDGVYSNCASGDEHLPMSQMSVWWQTLPYLLVGISEILTSITCTSVRACQPLRSF